MYNTFLQIIRARRSSLSNDVTNVAANDGGYSGNSEYERKGFGADWGVKAQTQNSDDENCAECNE
jgi:hypothetical protein